MALLRAFLMCRYPHVKNRANMDLRSYKYIYKWTSLRLAGIRFYYDNNGAGLEPGKKSRDND